MTDKPSSAAVMAVKHMRSCERLLASSGFYEQAADIRKSREQVERCSVTSVDGLRPDHGDYSPATIGKLADKETE